MAENVGSIVWTAEMQTAQLVAAEKQIGNSLAKTESSFIAAGKSAQVMNTQISKASSGVTNALAGVGRTAGQAGIQFQQFIGQIQGGVNPMVALSQQGADLGFVLGAPLLGAVVGISASLASMFLPALFDSKTAVEKLDEAVKNLGDAVEIKDDVALLTDEIRELAKVSEQAAMAQLAQEMIDARKVVQASAAVISESYDDIFGSIPISVLTTQIDRYKKAISEGGEAARIAAKGISKLPDIETKDRFAALEQAIRSVSKSFGVSRDSAFEYLQALSQVQKGANPESIQNLQNVLGKLSSETKFGNERLIEYASGMSKAFAEARNAGEIMQIAAGFMADFGAAVEKTESAASGAKSEFEKLISSIRFQAETAGMAEQQIAEFVVRQIAAKDSTIDLDAALKQVSGYYERIKAAETLTQKTKEQEQELNRAKTAWENLSESIAKQSATAESAAAANQYQIEQIQLAGQAAGKTAEEIQKLVDAQNALFAAQEKNKADKAEDKRESKVEELMKEIELQQIRNSLGNDEYELKSAINALGKDATPEEVTAITNQITQLQALRFEYELLGATIQESMQGVALNAMDNFSSGLARVITEGDSAREMFGNLAKTIATELLTAIIRYWVGQAAAAVVGQSAVTGAALAQIGTVTAAQVAQAAALTTAFTPAAIAVNIASFGAAGLAAAASAPIAAAATVSALTASSAASSAAGLAMGAGRKNGGPVNAGMIYPVSEGGDPELLMQGGRSYLLPGAGGGNVVSAKDMQVSGGGGSAPIINITNYSGSQASVQSQRFSEQDKRWVLDVVVGDMNKRGATHKAVTGTTNAVNRTS